MKKTKMEQNIKIIFFIIIIVIGIYFNIKEENKEKNIAINNNISYEISNIPNYTGDIYVEINNNIPKFSNEDVNILEDYYSNLENEKVRTSYDKN